MTATKTEREIERLKEWDEKNGNTLDKTIGETERRQSARQKAAEFMGVTDEKRICDVLRSVWRPPPGEPEFTDTELYAAIALIGQYGLDPVTREIYVTRNRGKLLVIIGIDGWIKVVTRTPGYDGHECELIRDDDGKVTACETRIHHRERKFPATYVAFADEYKRVAGIVEKQMPLHMLRLFSFRHAARFFTPIGGALLAEEVDAADRWQGKQESTVSFTDYGENHDAGENENTAGRDSDDDQDSGGNRPEFEGAETAAEDAGDRAGTGETGGEE